MDDEREAVLAALHTARRHVLTQVAGMSEADRRRSTVPSGWTPLGLVRHLTLSDERFWFEVVVAGGPLDFWPQGPDGDWRVAEDEPSDDVLGAYRQAIARSDEVVRGTPLDAPPRYREPGWPDEAFADLRAILLHVVVETATHAGQLDVARELADGAQYIVL